MKIHTFLFKNAFENVICKMLAILSWSQCVCVPHRFIDNPLRANFFRVNVNMYLHSMSFLRTNKTQVVEIPPWVRQGPAYTT